MKNLRLLFSTVPIALLILCILSFGLLIPWLGFYWDDWPLAWFSHALGPSSFIGFAGTRPFSGILYFLSASLVGEKPLSWQIYGLIWRWLCAVAMWWTLRKLWPQRGKEATLIAILFMVYPGFSQQSISLIYSLYFIYYALFIVSLGVMFWALRKPHWFWRLTILALLFSAGALLSTEYYYGLELLRPLFIWFVFSEEIDSFGERLKKTLITWLPYFLVVAGVFARRYIVSTERSYPVKIITDFYRSPIETYREYGGAYIQDLFEAALLAWRRVIPFVDLADFGRNTIILFWIGVVASFAISVFYLSRLDRNEETPAEERSKAKVTWVRQCLVLGISGLLVGGLSFWAADLPIRLNYPWDRGMLPMTFGASFLWIGILELLIRPRLMKVMIFAAAVGALAGFHFQTSATYLLDWRLQKDFFQQLVWRAPGIKEGTILLMDELPLSYYTDNSLTGPLNWVYYPEVDSVDLPLFLNYIGQRWGFGLPELDPGVPINLPYRKFQFQGSTSQALVIYYSPPACLRVLDPLLDHHFPGLPVASQEALPLSNLERIITNPNPAGHLPVEQFGPPSETRWCYYFEKADLARQSGDWREIVALGDVALDEYSQPNHPAELIPFIWGYAQSGDWERAAELTYESFDTELSMNSMLCDIWNDLEGGALVEDGQQVSSEIQGVLGCEP